MEHQERHPEKVWRLLIGICQCEFVVRNQHGLPQLYQCYYFGESDDATEVLLLRPGEKGQQILQVEERMVQFNPEFALLREKVLRQEMEQENEYLRLRNGDDIEFFKNEARKALKYILAIGVGALTWAVLHVGSGLISQNDRPLEAEKMEKAPAKQKAQDQFRFRLSDALERSEILFVYDQHEEALVEVSRAFEESLQGKYADKMDRLYLQRGMVHERLGNRHQAIADIEESGRLMSLKIQPIPWSLLHHLYVQTGDHEKARICRHIVEGIERGGSDRVTILADIDILLKKKS